MSEILSKLTGILNGKVLTAVPDEPDFFIGAWEERGNAKIAILYTYTERTGPIATPVIWIPSVHTAEASISESIRRIKNNLSYGDNQTEAHSA